MTGSSEIAERASLRAYRGGSAVAIATALVTVWTTIVRDDGNGIGSLMLVVAAAVGACSAWFGPAGMARTMLGVAIMQGLLGIAIATAPSTAHLPGGPSRALLSGAVLAAFWLMSAGLFRAAAKRRLQPEPQDGPP